MAEVWMPIDEFPQYSVSDQGRVMRVTGGRGSRAGYILRQRLNRDGYLNVTLQNLNRVNRKGFLVSRLVCAAFHGPPPTPDYQAAHFDGNRTNNSPDNLRWATPAENEVDKLRHGGVMFGERSPNAKLCDPQVRAIRQDDRSQSKIARDYGISQSLVCKVRTRRAWSHVA